jgi:hypothetical protein
VVRYCRRSRFARPRSIRASFAELAGASTVIVLPGASAGGFTDLRMEVVGKTEVYNAHRRHSGPRTNTRCELRNAFRDIPVSQN